MISSIWRNWTYSLFLGASCSIFVGCGGSDVPDPSMDGQAAAPEPVARPEPPAQVAASEPKAEEPAPAEPKSEPTSTPAEPITAPATPVATPTAVAATEQPNPASPAPAPTPVAATPAVASPTASDPATVAETSAKPAEASPKPDLGGTTSEMLALSSGSAPAPPAASGASPGGNGTGNAQGAPSTAFGDSRANGGSNPPLGRDRNFGEGPGGRAGSAASGRTAAMRRDDVGGGGLGRGGRDEEGGRGPGRDPNKAVDFTNPRESVQAFLDALKDKDVERLSEATALRSPYESSARNRELFQSILEGNISEAQLNDLAEKLDEYTIAGEAPVTSTGRLGILISRTVDSNRHQRTVIVRKEKAGWKVLDITSVIDFGRSGRGMGGGGGTRGGRR